MSPKVAKFFPLAIIAIEVLREIMNVIFASGYAFNYYYWKDAYLSSPVSIFVLLTGITLKAALVLTSFYLFYSYAHGKTKNAILVSVVMFIAFMFTGIHGNIYPSYNRNIPAILLGIVLFVGLIANIIISILVKNSVALAKNPIVIKPIPGPIAFNPPTQSYTLPAGQSVPDQLVALEKLHASGALTDAEFKSAKKKILE